MDLNLLSFRLKRENSADVCDDFLYIKWGLHKIEDSIAQLSQVKQIFNERLQKFILLYHHLAVPDTLGDLLWINRYCLQDLNYQLQEKEHRRNRSAHFVADSRCEVFCLDGGLFDLLLFKLAHFVLDLYGRVIHVEGN